MYILFFYIYDMKICKRCDLEKELNSFSKNKTKEDNHDIYCKECIKEYKKKYYSLNKQQIKEKCSEYYIDNKDRIIEKVTEYYINNKETKKEYLKEYYITNKEKIINNVKEYNLENKIYKREYYRKYDRRRKNTDPLYKLTNNMRNMILRYLKNNGYLKRSKTEEILGCSFDDFKLYLESKFEDWMDWENRGLYNGELNYGWDIDHKIPISSAKTENDIIRLSHYTNLQPLCSYTNRYIKKDKLDYEQQL